MLFEFHVPEAATVVRWVLRVVLVAFLAWLVRRRPEQEAEEEREEEDEVEEEERRWRDDDPDGEYGARRAALAKPRLRPANARYQNRRELHTRDPYAPREQYPPAAVRQRRPAPAQGEVVDFDGIIDKISKPKEMWEVRKSGDRPQLLFKRPSSSEVLDGKDTTPTSSGGGRDGGKDGKDTTPSSCGGGRDGGKETKAVAAADGSHSSAQATASAMKDGAPQFLRPPKKGMLHGHARPVTFIAWNRDGNLLFTCGKDKRVCVWNFPDGECLGAYVGHQGAVWSCSVTGDSGWLVTSGADRLVIVWEARNSREIARVELPGVARSVEWARAGGNGTGERFATCHNRFGAKPAALTIWHFDGKAIKEQLVIGNLPTAATQVRWGRDDEVLGSAHENGELVLWRADTGAEVRRLKAHDMTISKFDFSADRELVATASLDKSVKVWDLGAGTEGTLLFHATTDRPLNAVALGPLTRAAAVGSPELRPAPCSVIVAGGQDPRDVATSSSNSEQFDTLLFRLGDGAAFPDELKVEGSAKGHFGPVHTLAFAVDGSAIASGSEDGCVRLLLVDAAAQNVQE